MSDQILERLSRVETIVETLAEAQRETNHSIKDLTDTLRTTVLTRDEAAEIKADVKTMESKHDGLKERVDKAEGGMLAVKWLIGASIAACGGNVLLFIKLLATAAEQVDKLPK